MLVGKIGRRMCLERWVSELPFVSKYLPVPFNLFSYPDQRAVGIVLSKAYPHLRPNQRLE